MMDLCAIYRFRAFPPVFGIGSGTIPHGPFRYRSILRSALRALKTKNKQAFNAPAERWNGENRTPIMSVAMCLYIYISFHRSK